MTSKQALLLLTMVASARSRPGQPARFSYLRKQLHQDPNVQLLLPEMAGKIDVLMSDLRALAREELVVMDHEDSIFGIVELTPAGYRAADGL